MAKEKDNCWKSFSKYIRIKGCLETTGLPFVGICITCERQFHIGMLEAGHLIGGRKNSVLFSEKLVNNQCTYCNRIQHGEYKKYKKAMCKRYGEERLERWIIRLKRRLIADRNMDFSGRCKRYGRKMGILLRRHGYKTWRELLQEGQS